MGAKKIVQNKRRTHRSGIMGVSEGCRNVRLKHVRKSKEKEEEPRRQDLRGLSQQPRKEFKIDGNERRLGGKATHRGDINKG